MGAATPRISDLVFVASKIIDSQLANLSKMKKQYIVILLILFAGLNTQAQTSLATPVDSTLHIGLNTYLQPVSLMAVNIPSQQEYRHYLRTAKTLKILGWTSLGLGIPTTFLGMLFVAAGNFYSPGGTNPIGVSVIVSGSVLTLSSIPLFIVSHHYKKKGKELKAISLSLGSQQVFIPQGNRFASSVQPAVSVKVSL